MRDLIAIGKFVVAVFKKSDRISLHLPEDIGPADNVGDMEVMAIGPACTRDIKLGDFVMASPKDVIKYRVDEDCIFISDNGFYYLIHEDNVRAVLREKVTA